MRFKIGDLVTLSREEVEFVAHEHLGCEPELEEITDEQWKSLHREILNEYLFGVVVGSSGARRWPVVQWMPKSNRQTEEPEKITLYSKEIDSANYQERYQS